MRKLSVLMALIATSCSSTPQPKPVQPSSPPPAAYAPPVAAPRETPPAEPATIEVPRATGPAPIREDDSAARKARVDAILKQKGVSESGRKPGDRISSSTGGEGASDPAPGASADERALYARDSIKIGLRVRKELIGGDSFAEVVGDVSNMGKRTVRRLRLTLFYQDPYRRDVGEESVFIEGPMRPGYSAPVEMRASHCPKTWWPPAKNVTSGSGHWRVEIQDFELE